MRHLMFCVALSLVVIGPALADVRIECGGRGPVIFEFLCAGEEIGPKGCH